MRQSDSPGAALPRTGRKGVRVLLGVGEISGYYLALTEGLRELGVDATFISLHDHPFGYGNDRDTPLLACWTAGAYRRYGAAAARRAPVRFVWLALAQLLRCLLFVWAALRFDVFVYGYGTAILGRPEIEYRLLRFLRRTILSVFHGSDSRPPYLDGSIMARDRGRTTEQCMEFAALNKARALRADRYAAYVVDSPASAHFHERRCVSGFHVGIPIRIRETGSAAEPECGPDRPVRVLHSPSHPEAKGTPHIVRAVESLRARGHRIELVLMTGRRNSEVMEELAKCDFVVDQLYSDTPMAGFAAEAASVGKPAVVGGYAEEVFREHIPAEILAPTLYCHPDEIESAIERMVVDRSFRLELGRRAKAFVEARCAAREVAARFLRLIEGNVPEEWLFDPREIRYFQGCGLSEPAARELVRKVVGVGGRSALMLSDKPVLEQAIIDFAHMESPEPVAACSAGF